MMKENFSRNFLKNFITEEIKIFKKKKEKEKIFVHLKALLLIFFGCSFVFRKLKKKKIYFGRPNNI